MATCTIAYWLMSTPHGRMHGLVFGPEGDVDLLDVPVPEPGADEVLVSVEAVGLCGSDLAAIGPGRSIETTPGAVLGHEITGVVVREGPQAAGNTGKRVVVHPNINCGRCEACRAGRPNLCPTQYTLGIHRDGGAAQYVAVPVDHVYAVDDRVPPAAAALAEPLACVLNGVDKAGLRPGETVAVLGAGPIGLLFAHVLGHMGMSEVVVTEPSPYRARLAKALGATVVVPEDLGEAVAAATGGRGASVVIDAVGGLLEPAMKVIAPAGRILLFGAHPAVSSVDALRLLYAEISITGVFTALHTFPRAVRLLEDHWQRLEMIVSHRLPLDRFDDAIAAMRSSESGKVLLEPHSPAQ